MTKNVAIDVDTSVLEWKRNTDLFVVELHQGYAVQAWLGHILLGMGLSVRLPRLTLRDNPRDSYRWACDNDLLVAGRLLEVKSRRLRFTGTSDYPYPDVMVDTVRGWDAKRPEPDACVCVSRSTSKLIFLRSDTKPEWTTIAKTDRVRNIQDDFYMARIELWGSSREFVAWLESYDT